MDIDMKSRCTGKTMGLIYRSHMTNVPILTFSSQSAKCIKMDAERIGVSIPEPYYAEQFRNEIIKAGSFPTPGKVLIDELPIVLKRILGTTVEAATITHNESFRS